MIKRRSKRGDAENLVEPKWFDDYDLRLGDVMRGERATMGKSLLDVQRELRIKASYIAAIENADPDAFDTPGFIAGYVRSYARYLNMDPDRAFAQFCAESGFSTAHGMSDAASAIRKDGVAANPAKAKAKAVQDPMFDRPTPFAPSAESVFSRIEPGAVGSLLVLVALVGALGFGGWTVLNEVQRVQLTPAEATPDVLADLDPLEQATRAPAGVDAPELAAASDRFDRLYRPEALDVPVLVARDAPISTLRPEDVGTFAGLSVETESPVQGDAPVDTFAQGVQIVAARPAWIRMNGADGAVLFSGILNAGETLAVPAGAEAPLLRVGESGSIYYMVDGEVLGPTGPRGSVTENFELSAEALRAALPAANLGRDSELQTVLAELGATGAGEAAQAVPQVFAQERDVVTVIATREVWLRVRSAGGTILHEAVMQPGDFYTVPQTDEPSTIRAGDAGAVYFAANGETFGPYGPRGAVADSLKLNAESIVAELEPADWQTNEQLARAVAQLDAEGAFEVLNDQ